MATIPIVPEPVRRDLPDYLPARMVNEFIYCPRLFHYEWVQGVFRESADTVEGSQQHRRVDREGAGLPAAGDLAQDRIHARSITLSSDRYRVIAKMDLIEVEDGTVTPVDYKHGRPREGDHGVELWPTDRMQLAVQGLVLRENGYRCEAGVIYYTGTRQRVRVAFGPELMADCVAAIDHAWECSAGQCPPPLTDSPKCTGCSLVPVCLPDETNALRDAAAEEDNGQLMLFEELPAPRKPPRSEVRRLVTSRDDLRPAYINTQGLRVGKSGEVLQVKEKEALRQEIRIGEMCQLNLMGNIQISTQAVQSLCEAEVPVCYFSQGGWFYGIAMGLNTKNVFLRQRQFRLAEEEWFCLRLARQLVSGKIRNQRTMLLRNHLEPAENALRGMKEMAARAERAGSLDELLGVEGTAARLYFGEFAGMIKIGEEGAAPSDFDFDFNGRNRRPPRDPVNALLSLAYSLLAKDLTIACYAVGFDPMMGFYHQPRFGRPALALDLMESFRPLIADSAVLNAINTRMVTAGDFIRAGSAVSLTATGAERILSSI